LEPSLKNSFEGGRPNLNNPGIKGLQFLNLFLPQLPMPLKFDPKPKRRRALKGE